MAFSKKDSFTLRVDKSEVVISSKEYSLDFLLKQKAKIQEQKDRDNINRDAELAEISELILEAGKLGIVSR